MIIYLSRFNFLQIIYCSNRNYSEQELNMGNFLHANDNDLHMYAKFGDLSFHAFFQLITPRFDL
jgi:hypothetical protein